MIALSFILQGCASNETEALKISKGGREEMAKDWTSVLFQAVEKGDLDALQNALDQGWISMLKIQKNEQR